MRLLLPVLFLIGLASWADTGFIVHPENTAQCAVKENLIAKTSASMPRTEFFSCTSPTVKQHLRPLDAVVEYGRKTDGGAAIYAIVSTPDVAARLQKKYPGVQFISRQDKAFTQYQAELTRLLVRKKKTASQRL